MFNSIYAPFAATPHLIICFFATIFYLFMFFKTKKNKYLAILIAIDLTLVTQLKINKTIFYVLTIIEIILVIFIIYSYFKERKKDKGSLTNE